MRTLIWILQFHQFVQQMLYFRQRYLLIALYRHLTCHGSQFRRNYINTDRTSLPADGIQQFNKQLPLSNAVQICRHFPDAEFIASKRFDQKAKLNKHVFILA